MNRPIKNEYRPDTVSPPGESLQEILDDRQMTQKELADRTGRPPKTINEIVKGKSAITPETAIQLERVLGISASFWNNLERNYREWRAREAEAAGLRDATGWLEKLPVAEMAKRGWIELAEDSVDQVRALLQFFGVASPDEFQTVIENPQATFRHSRAKESESGALGAWLRRGEILGRSLDTGEYDKNRLLSALQEIRGSTRRPFGEGFQTARELCAEAGVAVVAVESLAGCRAHGATRWLSPGKALVQLSFRYRWADIFWFTFFHEAGHVIRHGKKAVFIEGDRRDGDEQEREADSFASELLIPSNELKELEPSARRQRLSKKQVRAFATRIGVSPGIVVGRLHHLGLLPRNHMNGLREKLPKK